MSNVTGEDVLYYLTLQLRYQKILHRVYEQEWRNHYIHCFDRMCKSLKKAMKEDNLEDDIAKLEIIIEDMENKARRLEEK